MKIFAIANRIFSAQGVKQQSNNGYYFASRYNLDASNLDSFERVSFQGRGLDFVNPSRKVFDKLPQDKLTCACCGRLMILPSQLSSLEESGVLRCKAPKAIKIISKYEQKLHTVEKEVLDILKEGAEKHPDWDFQQILASLKPNSEKHLIKIQFGIFKLIERASQNLSPKLKSQINDLLTDETNKIMSGNNEFKRKSFVTKFEEILKAKKNSAVKEHLIRIATKLPTSYEDKNAFIVKYSNRSAEAIGLRLLRYSMKTVEHVKPQNCKGENHIFNYILECMRCNSFRQDRPMVQQLEEYPEMFSNAQHQMDNFVNWANEGLLSKWYIIKIQQRIYSESDKTLKPDISKLKLRKDMYEEYSKLNKLEIVEDEPNKKLSKKELKRQKIKEMHNKKHKTNPKKLKENKNVKFC